MNSKASQVESLLAYLRKHPEGIDRKTAEEELGICSLSRRICDVQEAGHGIKRRWREVKTRYTKPTKIAVYSLDVDKVTEAPATPAADRSPDKDDRPVPAPPSQEPKRFEPPTQDRRGNRLLFP